jgi:broad specificity phosphatase PhoE
MRDLVLVRHAQASFGAADYDALSDLGHEQARALGRALAERLPRPDLVLAGAMRRHRHTAEIALAAAGIEREVVVEPRWNEYDHDALLRALDARYADRAALAEDVLATDDPRRAFQRLFARALERWTGGAHDADYAETWPAFRARVTDALARLHARDDAETALVFTSGGPILAACQLALDVPTSEAFRLGHALANASLTTLVARASGGWRLASFNETGHAQGKLRTFR